MLCNLSQVYCKSNFVLQRIVAEKKRCFCLPCPKFCFLNLHPLFFLATCFSRHCDEVSGKNFCNAVCCGEDKCQLRHVFCVTSAKGQKHLFQLVNFFRGRFPLPFVLQKIAFCFAKLVFNFAKFTVVFQTTKLTANERRYLAKIRAEKLFRGRFWAIK